MRSTKLAALLPALFGVSCIVSQARADEASRAQAQGLFDEGLKLMDAGRYGEACPKFIASNRLDPAGGTQMNVALCHEREGKTATAVLDYQTALAQAVRDKRKERESFAKERIDALTPLVPKVVIRVPDGEAKTAQVTIDGTAVAPEALGTPLSLDPGPHQAEAFFPATGQRTTTPFTLRTGEAKNIRFGSNEGAVVGGLGIGTPAGPGDRAGGSRNSGESARSKYGPIFGWVGAGALVASAVTGTFALVNYVSYKDNCADGRNFCKSQDGVNAASRTNTHAILSTIFLGVGAAALIVIPILPSGSGGNAGAAPSARVAVTPQGASFDFTARF